MNIFWMLYLSQMSELISMVALIIAAMYAMITFITQDSWRSGKRGILISTMIFILSLIMASMPNRETILYSYGLNEGIETLKELIRVIGDYP